VGEISVKQSVTEEKLAICTLQIGKDETSLADIGAVVAHLRARIEAHPKVRLIGVFDHYAHTANVAHGTIAPEILAAQNILLCFGLTLPDPQSLALRPRSIGICELADRFVISFLEAPMPVANSTIEEWAASVCERPVALVED